MSKKLPQKIILTALTVLWMAVIFCFSAQSGDSSGGMSERIIVAAAKLVGFDPLQQDTLDILQTVVRKGAHFMSYATLCVLAFPTVISYGSGRRRGCVMAIAICFLYAVTDELHQCFVSGRNGTPIDVCIDTAGAIFGLAVFLLVARLIRSK